MRRCMRVGITPPNRRYPVEAKGSEMGTKDKADAPQLRTVGDIIIIHADGLTRKQLRKLAVECFRLMRSMTVSENH